ncbi:MAG: DUF6364 family protein [bacterium]
MKTKLTLYVDKEVSDLAREIATLTGKSISTLVKEFFIEKAKKTKKFQINPSLNKWVGILNTSEDYKVLRDKFIIDNRIEKYENIS